MWYLSRIDPIHPVTLLLIEKLQGAGKGSQDNENNVDFLGFFFSYLVTGTLLTNTRVQVMNERFGV